MEIREDERLLPCPFCGPRAVNPQVVAIDTQAAMFHGPFQHVFGWRVCCGGCGCSSGHCAKTIWCDAYEAAVASWNSRNGSMRQPAFAAMAHKWTRKCLGGPPDVAESREVVEVCESCGLENFWGSYHG